MVKRKEAKGKKAGSVKMDFTEFMAAQAKDGTIIDLTDREDVFYSFGDYNLDRASGGGVTAGSIVAFQGPSGSGKSLAALSISREVVKQGGRVAYFDTENKISPKAIRMLGLADNELFMHLTISNLQDTIDKIMEFAESGFFKLIVVDSTDALVSDEMEEREIHSISKVGGYSAKTWSEWLPSVTASLQRSAEDNEDDIPATLLLVRQVRDNPSAMYGGEVTSGGRAIEYYCSSVFRFGSSKSEDVTEDGMRTMQGATVRVLKTTQGAVPKDPVHIRYYIGDDRAWGIDGILSLADEAIRLRILPPKTPTSHMYIACDELCELTGVEPGELKFNGKNNLLKALMSDDIFYGTVKELIDKRLAEGFTPADEEDEDIEMDFEEIDE